MSWLNRTDSVFATGYIAEYENSLEIASVLQDDRHTTRHKEATTNNENVPPSITKVMYRSLPDAALEALANMSHSDEDFEVSVQDIHISGEENDYKTSDFEANNYDAVVVQQI
ncbi:hypothetical protein FQA39_LY05364 [Lamprigera yunnana]|nr:hypothetical protein FQA39_LY05364 [Lamprigera yunnana]